MVFWCTLSFGVLAVLVDLVSRLSRTKPTTADERYIPTHLREAVLARDDYRCRYCGRRPQSLDIDDIIPVNQWGKSTFDNLVTACAQCNLKRSGRHPNRPECIYCRLGPTEVMQCCEKEEVVGKPYEGEPYERFEVVRDGNEDVTPQAPSPDPTS